MPHSPSGCHSSCSIGSSPFGKSFKCVFFLVRLIRGNTETQTAIPQLWCSWQSSHYRGKNNLHFELLFSRCIILHLSGWLLVISCFSFFSGVCSIHRHHLLISLTSCLMICYIKPDINSLILQHPTDHLLLISVPCNLSWPVSLLSARAHAVFVPHVIFRWKFLVFFWLLHCDLKDWIKLL